MAGEQIRETRLDVKPGLYVLRYVGSADARTAPSATVRAVMASSNLVDIVSVPGTQPGELGGPGSSVVIVASAASAVQISLKAFRDSQNLDAKFSLDLLGSANPLRAISPDESTAAGGGTLGDRHPAQAAFDLRLVAHVSRRGDVGVDEDGWIAGPRAPSTIEAIQIEIRGCDVGVAAQFRNVESRSAWSAWMAPGAVIGVARKACALTGLRLKLVGPEADHYDIMGEALFLGTPRSVAKGGEIEFVAPGEIDPLIGLKLTLAERTLAHATQTSEKSSRVRVFR